MKSKQSDISIKDIHDYDLLCEERLEGKEGKVKDKLLISFSIMIITMVGILITLSLMVTELSYKVGKLERDLDLIMDTSTEDGKRIEWLEEQFQ